MASTLGDVQVYGALNAERRSEWQPTFELTAPNGSAVVVYPGMVHDRMRGMLV